MSLLFDFVGLVFVFVVWLLALYVAVVICLHVLDGLFRTRYGRLLRLPTRGSRPPAERGPR